MKYQQEVETLRSQIGEGLRGRGITPLYCMVMF